MGLLFGSEVLEVLLAERFACAVGLDLDALEMRRAFAGSVRRAGGERFHLDRRIPEFPVATQRPQIQLRARSRRSAPKHSEGLVEELQVFGTPDHDRPQGQAELVLATDVDPLGRAAGIDGVAGRDLETQSAQQARELQQVL